MSVLDLRAAKRLFYGTAEVKALYYGATLLWSKPASGGAEAYSFDRTFEQASDIEGVFTRASLSNWSDRPITTVPISIVNGRMRSTCGTNTLYPDSAFILTGLEIGRTYDFTIDFVARTTGGTATISVRNGPSSATADAPIIWPASGGGPYGLEVTPGTHTGSFVATQETHYFYLGSGAGTPGQYVEWDNLHVTSPGSVPETEAPPTNITFTPVTVYEDAAVGTIVGSIS